METSVQADAHALYIAGFDGRSLFLTAYNTSMALSGTGQLVIDAITNLNYDGSVKNIPVSLALTADRYGTGAHLYFVYKQLSSGHFVMGAAWTGNYGVSFGAAADILDLSANYNMDDSQYAMIPSLNSGGRIVQPSSDWITTSGLNGTASAVTTGFQVLSAIVTLPAIISQIYVTSITSTNFYLTRSVTITVTTIPVAPDLGTTFVSILMAFFIVAIVSGVFATIGTLIGGGSGGIFMFEIGVLAGLGIGILIGFWPPWVTFFVAYGAFVLIWRTVTSRNTGGEMEYAPMPVEEST
jgi:hypothetical protein